MESNFSCLDGYWSRLADIGREAEKLYRVNNQSCVAKIGVFAEKLTEEIMVCEHLEKYINDKQFDRIELLKNRKTASPYVVDKLHKIRMARNKVEHDNEIQSLDETKQLLEDAYHLAVWFAKEYGIQNDIIRNFHEPDMVKVEKEKIYCPTKSQKREVEKSGGSNVKEVVFKILFVLSVLLNVYFIIMT